MNAGLQESTACGASLMSEGPAGIALDIFLLFDFFLLNFDF